MSAPGMLRAAKENTRSDWETPQYIFDALNEEFDFNLDGAASSENAKCMRYLSVEPPGLYSYTGNHGDAFSYGAFNLERIWLNPPYGAMMPAWIDLCQSWQLQGATVVALLPSATDTRWFHTIYDTADEIRFLTGRIQFVGTTSSNPTGSLFAIWRGHSPIWGSPRVSLVTIEKP